MNDRPQHPASLADQIRAARVAEIEQREAMTRDIRRAAGMPAHKPETPALIRWRGFTAQEVEQIDRQAQLDWEQSL